MVLQQVGTQLAPASDKAAFGRIFAHCFAHVGLYEADNFLKRQKLTLSDGLTVYLLNKRTSISLRSGNSNVSDACHQAFHSVGTLKRGKMSF